MNFLDTFYQLCTACSLHKDRELRWFQAGRFRPVSHSTVSVRHKCTNTEMNKHYTHYTYFNFSFKAQPSQTDVSYRTKPALPKYRQIYIKVVCFVHSSADEVVLSTFLAFLFRYLQVVLFFILFV